MINKSIIIGLLAIFIVSTGEAQNIELNYEGSLVTIDTVEIQGDVNADTLYSYIFQGDTTYYYAYEVLAEIDVTNTALYSLDVQCKKRYIQIVSGSENTFCWISCFPPYTFESIIPATIRSNETITTFSGYYKPCGKLGCTLVAYTFFNDDNPNDSAMVVVKYIMQDCNPNAIAENTKVNDCFSSPYPNPAKNMLFVRNKAVGFKTGSFVLYNSLGVNVKTFLIKSTTSVLNFNIQNLKAGIYFYRIITDNTLQKTGIINISH